MTLTEACTHVVELVRELRLVRAELRAWQLLATQAIHHAHALHTELEQVRKSYHRLLDERRESRRPAA